MYYPLTRCETGYHQVEIMQPVLYQENTSACYYAVHFVGCCLATKLLMAHISAKVVEEIMGWLG